MKRFRDVLVGVLIGCMIMATPVLAESIFTKIDVVLNGVNVQLEGEDVEVNSILYNGSTYLPMRRVVELVGKDIEWNGETMTANIVKKGDESNLETTANEFIIYNPNTKDVYGQKNGDMYQNLRFIKEEIEKYPDYYLDYNNDTQELIIYENTEDKKLVVSIEHYVYKDQIFVSELYFNNKILPLIDN